MPILPPAGASRMRICSRPPPTSVGSIPISLMNWPRPGLPPRLS
jgi:hypothetical protein